MEYLVIYKHSNDEELATIKCLLALRKQQYITFEDLVSKYTEKFDIDIDQIENYSKLYSDCLIYNKNYLMDNNIYLLVYTRDLDKLKVSNLIYPYPTYIYSLNINMEIIDDYLPF